MGIMTKERFATLLEPYLFDVYELYVEKGEDIIPRLFGVHNSNLSYEKLSGIGATGLMRTWQGQVYYDDVRAMWDKTYTHKKYSIGLKIERDLWDDAQHNEVRDRVNAVTLSVFRTRQEHAHSVFNNAFAASYTDYDGETITSTGPDGKALCATDHLNYPGAVSPNVQSNAGTSPFTIDAVEATRILMMNFTDDRGKKLFIQPDTLLLPPGLMMQAQEYFQSAGRADTADRVDNVRKGAYKLVELPFATDSNNWFMIDSKLAKQFLKWFERRKPIPEKDEDFDTEVLKWKYVSRYSYGFHHWAWVYGHAVT